MKRTRIFHSLQQRNFRIFFIGQLISLHGTWMQSVAQAWLVYRLTESGFMLGLTGTATLLPALIFGLFGGALADRFNRKKLLIVVQTLAMVQAVVLAVLTLAGWITPWLIVGMALLLGFVQAVETPIRQSFVAQLVPRETLHNAIGLNSSMFHLARFIGPATAGFLVAWFGEGVVFAINALSFLAVIVSLGFIRETPKPTESDASGKYQGFWAGLRFAAEHSLVGAALLTVALTSIFGSSIIILLPIYVAEIFNRGPQSLGWLMAMLGAGSLMAALSLAGRQNIFRLEKRIAAAGVSMAICLMLFSWNAMYGLALLILPVVGFAATSIYASSNALVQFAVPDPLRGRIMAIYTVCLHGMVSLGQLALGALADWTGAPLTVMLSATCLLATVGFTAMVMLRAAAAADNNSV
jgi:MFS family permease